MKYNLQKIITKYFSIRVVVLEEQRIAMERMKHHVLLQEHGFVTMDNEVNIITDVLQ